MLVVDRFEEDKAVVFDDEKQIILDRDKPVSYTHLQAWIGTGTGRL